MLYLVHYLKKLPTYFHSEFYMRLLLDQHCSHNTLNGDADLDQNSRLVPLFIDLSSN